MNSCWDLFCRRLTNGEKVVACAWYADWILRAFPVRAKHQHMCRMGLFYLLSPEGECVAELERPERPAVILYLTAFSLKDFFGRFSGVRTKRVPETYFKL